MAVGPDTVPPVIHAVAGARIGVVEAGIRKKNRRDVVVFEFAPGTALAATFTKNQFCAAPVLRRRPFSSRCNAYCGWWRDSSGWRSFDI